MSKAAPDPIDDIATGYQSSQILLAANRLGIFAALGNGSKDARRLAADLDASPRGMRILCDALVDLGLLDRVGPDYANSPDARKHLLPDSPEPRSDLLSHGAKQYERWGRLYDAVKSGTPVPDDDLDPRLLEGERAFARAMADVGRRSAAATCEQLDLSGARQLLDVGGGPGIYAIEFAQRWPGLRITVLDTEEALAVARQNVTAAGLADRIHLHPGDAFVDDLAGPFDAIFVSNVIHIYSAVDNQKLIERCAASLAPGGQLILKDFFLDANRRNPPGGVVFAVNMLVSTDEGDCYTVGEAQSWFEAAGLRFEVVKDVASKSRLLIARKE